MVAAGRRAGSIGRCDYKVGGGNGCVLIILITVVLSLVSPLVRIDEMLHLQYAVYVSYHSVNRLK